MTTNTDALDPTLVALNLALLTSQDFPAGSLQWYSALAAAAELAGAYHRVNRVRISVSDEGLHALNALNASMRALLPAAKSVMPVAQAVTHIDAAIGQIEGDRRKARIDDMRTAKPALQLTE